MLWRGRRGSGNIVDRRGAGGGRRAGFGFGRGSLGGGGLGGGGLGGGGLGGGGLGGLGRLGGRGGWLGMLILVGVVLLFGFESGFLGGEQAGDGGQVVSSDEEEELVQFVAVVLADTEDAWNQLFQERGEAYREPKLVLFRDAVESACGYADAAVGPFYCPGDDQIYLDLGFFQALASRFGAPGDFAQAYVIAHEVGHHVQNELGILPAVNQQRAQASEREANELSVRLELQADCLAGVWAHHAEETKGVLEPGDIAEALGAAAAVGDDQIQKQASGRVRPDSFTHGSSAQRQRWFEEGYESGRMENCDTFSVAEP